MKKLYFKGLVTVMACSFLFSMGACGGNASTNDNYSESNVSEESVDNSESSDILQEPETLETVTVNVAENVTSSNQQTRVFRQIGRTFVAEGGDTLRCDFTCTGIAFNALCKGEVKVKFWASAKCYFAVYVDGVRMDGRIMIGEETNDEFVTVASFAEYGQHEIRLVKESQYVFAYSGVTEVQLTGSLGKRPAQKERFLEFYGDSILNGSNIHTGGTSVETTDGTLAFGYQSALALDADCSIIGRGGMGLYNKDSSTEGMNQIWNLTSSSKAPGVTEYDFSRIPDAVVVELGCNDVISKYYTEARYKESIQVMIDNIHSAYGNDMRIVWCYGYNETMDEKWDLVKSTLDALNTNGTILYCELPLAPLSKENGGDGWHPNVEISKTITAEMIKFLEENIYN